MVVICFGEGKKTLVLSGSKQYKYATTTYEQGGLSLTIISFYPSFHCCYHDVAVYSIASYHQQQQHAVASTSSGPASTASASSSARSTAISDHSPATASNIAQWFNDHAGFAPVATTLSEARGARPVSMANFDGSMANPGPSATATAYSVLNQMMAREFGTDAHFAETATALSALPQQQAHFLTRPVS